MVDGLRRYNEIQKALSAFRKQSGVRFAANFHATASQLYRKTKDQPLKHVINNIDKAYEGLIPELPSEYFEPEPFFTYDINNKNGMGKVEYRNMPINLKVKSPQLMGKDWIGTTEDLEYEVIFRKFTDYMNKNLNVIWNNSTDAPCYFFSEVYYDEVEKSYITQLMIDRDDTYGFEPDMEPVQREVGEIEPAGEHEAELPEEPEEEIIPEKPAKGKKPKKLAPDKEEKAIRKIKAETNKTKAETAKIKASEKRLSEFNKAADKLEKLFERGILTKKEYKAAYKKLLDM